MNECELGEDGAFYLGAGLLQNRTLRTLNVSDNKFCDEGIN
jgi:hypothetical protein